MWVQIPPSALKPLPGLFPFSGTNLASLLVGRGSSMMSDEMTNEPRGAGRIPTIWIVALVVLGILVLGDLNRRMADARRLEQDAITLETEVAGMATERVELMTQVAEATSEPVIAEWAHEQAKMVLPGEVLVVPVAPGGALPTAESGETGQEEPPSNFEIWLALLFGG
jgi:cell division protein FtsB